ncbi:antibiotic biosynthesis monooxygenase [bacterium]|nr:antibiotic biosynthesis monooxygenase [bacterium]
MYVVTVTVFVKPEHTQDFINATLENAEGTRREPGNVRFDVLQAEDDPNRFFLYEVYKTPEDFKKHQETEHYLTWRDTVADWMAQKRVGLKYHSIYPKEW